MSYKANAPRSSGGIENVQPSGRGTAPESETKKKKVGVSSAVGVSYRAPLESFPTYEPSELYGGESQAQLIEDIYNAQRDAKLAALREAYEQNLGELARERERVGESYYLSGTRTAGNAAAEREALNEAVAANGLNTGAATQARLAQSSALQNALGALERERAQNLADIDAKRAAEGIKYREGVLQAIAEGDFAKAEALYGEAVRVDNNKISASKAEADEKYRSYDSALTAFLKWLAQD